MLNPYHYSWKLCTDIYPRIDRECYILVEHDVIEVEDDPAYEYPFVRKARLMYDSKPIANQLLLQWELLDATEDEDVILHQDVTVIAWRYFSDRK